MAPKGPPPARARPTRGCLRAGTRAAQLVDALLQVGELARERADVTGGRDTELADGAADAVFEHALEGIDRLGGAALHQEGAVVEGGAGLAGFRDRELAAPGREGGALLR